MSLLKCVCFVRVCYQKIGFVVQYTSGNPAREHTSLLNLAFDGLDF